MQAERGQSLVEFSLILPVFLALVMGVVEFAVDPFPSCPQPLYPQQVTEGVSRSAQENPYPVATCTA